MKAKLSQIFNCITLDEQSMKNILKYTMFTAVMAVAPALLAQTPAEAASWHAKTVWEALLGTALFAIFGFVLAILGYKLFDYFTPGDLHKEILENKNVAAAVIGAAVIIGICIVVAAAMG